MTGTLRISILFILEVSLTLRCSGVRIRDHGKGSEITYDPDRPGLTKLACEHNDGSIIKDARWTRNGETLTNINQGGRLILNSKVIGTENPQSFEGMYRCETDDERSDPLAFYGKTYDYTCTMIILSQCMTIATDRHCQ